jgi:hypothetical protein
MAGCFKQGTQNFFLDLQKKRAGERHGLSEIWATESIGIVAYFEGDLRRDQHD